MANALKDNNYVYSKLAVLNTDGVTLVPIALDESTGAMKINTTDTISFTMTPLSPEDENYHKCLLFKGTDGLAYPWVANSSGEVLVDQ